MNRRIFTLGSAAVALAEITGATAGTKSGTCGSCKNDGSCQQGLQCFSGVCGPVAAACGGRLWKCPARRHLQCSGGTAVCYRKNSNKRKVSATPLC